MKTLLRAPVIAGLMLMSPLCMAEPYFGGSLLSSEYSDYEDVGHGFGGKAYAGYHINWFMLEASYLDTGKAKIDDAPGISGGKLGFSGANISAGYFAKLDRKNSGVWGKLGYYTGKASLEGNFFGVSQDAKVNSSGFSFGIGGEWMFSPHVGLRGEIESLQNVKDILGPAFSGSHESNITLASLGLIINFGNVQPRHWQPAAPVYQVAPQPAAPPEVPAVPTAVEPPPAAAAEPAPASETAPAPEAAPVAQVDPQPLMAAPSPPAPPAAPAMAPGAGTAEASMGAVMRQQPTSAGLVILKLPKGGNVELISHTPNATGGWWWVRYGKATGWINESQLWMNTQ